MSESDLLLCLSVTFPYECHIADLYSLELMKALTVACVLTVVSQSESVSSGSRLICSSGLTDSCNKGIVHTAE